MISAQTRNKEQMLVLCKIIEKSLLLRESGSSTSSANPNASNKVFPLVDLLLKATKRWNWANLSYFDSCLDIAHEEDEIVFIGKNIY